MCRLAASIGPAQPLAALIYDAPHSLERQAYLPREMCSGHVNVDGTGVAWWPRAGEGAPLRYVTERPPWSDPNLPTLARGLAAEVVVAAVRSATPGMPFSAAAVGPFVADGLAFAHNGFVADFERSVARRALAELPDDLFGELQVRTDSTVLFALVRSALRDNPDAGLAAAQRRGTERLAALCEEAGVAANLVSVLTDGSVLCALRRAVGTDANSLYSQVCTATGRSTIASEPLDPIYPPNATPDGRTRELGTSEAGTSEAGTLGVTGPVAGRSAWEPVGDGAQVTYERSGHPTPSEP